MPDIPVGTALSIGAVAFGCWAWVVAWGVAVMRKELGELKSHIGQIANNQQAHITQTERRLTMLETEFSYVKAEIFGRANGWQEP